MEKRDGPVRCIRREGGMVTRTQNKTTALRIRPYCAGDVACMLALYNEQTRGEAHVAPLDRAMFAQLVEAKSYFAPDGLFVACDSTGVAGWVHAVVTAPTEGWYDPSMRLARLSMLVYRPGSLAVGQALVERATAWLRDQGSETIYALHAHGGYPFYRGLFLGGEFTGPTTLAHLHQALACSGYEIGHESVFQRAALNTTPVEVSPKTDDTTFHDEPLKVAHDTMAQSWTGFEPRTVTAVVAGAYAGQIGYVLQPHLAGRLGHPCVNIYMLGVNPSHRQMGLASALVSRALRAGHAAGARTATVGTELDNIASARTYARFGFAAFRLNVGRVLRAAEG